MKTYTGGCHCGAVRYEVDMEPEQAMVCNCSHCHIKGLVLTFVSPEQFRLTKGSEDELTDYQFNKKTIHHFFCPVCGVESFARGKKGEETMYAINLRCIDGLDLDAIPVLKVNGKDF